MILKIAAALGVLIAVFLFYVSTKNGNFRYERSGFINAKASEIFPIVSNLKRGREWSPYEKKDPNMKSVFAGPDGEVGSTLEFDGNKEVGSGKLEILKLVPNELVQLQLTMTKPFHGVNLIEYRLTPEGEGTHFSWSMSGDGGFMGKLISTFINCEDMVTKDFVVGIQNLKTLVESKVESKTTTK